MLLSPEERERFARYCLVQADSYSGTARQLKELNVPMLMVQREEGIAAAYRIVADHLLLVEDA